MMPDPREPHDIAQQIIDGDEEAMDELLKDTEVEDPDLEEYDLPDSDEDTFQEDEDDIEYF
jgi:hypothetical protein